MTSRAGGWLALLFLSSLAAGTSPLLAQSTESSLGPAPLGQGPTREAQAATVLDADQRPGKSRPILRYQAFQRDFQRDFGLATPLASGAGGLLGLRARLEERWGNTTVYQWLERGLAAYTWFRASTSTERRGFDIRMDTDDMAEGRVGVEMSRPLGSADAE